MPEFPPGLGLSSIHRIAFCERKKKGSGGVEGWWCGGDGVMAGVVVALVSGGVG